jgi:hypothetical protein
MQKTLFYKSITTTNYNQSDDASHMILLFRKLAERNKLSSSHIGLET